MLGAWRIQQWLRRRRERALLRDAEAAVSRFPQRRRRSPHGLPAPLVVSLTSYPARYPTLAKTLRSLLDQTVGADHTVLWISQDDLQTLPAEVRALEAMGLEIRSCQELRSFKKLIPALDAFPGAFIATFDDDVFYRPDLLADLVSQFDPADPAIIAGRAHMARLMGDGRLAPYDLWENNTLDAADAPPDRLLFPTGVGGVLYPPHALGDAAADRDRFMSLCPRGDDLWFFWMALRNGTPRRRIAAKFDLVAWDGSQEAGLANDNLYAGGNDRQIQALENALGRLG